jgi:ankyrin repeat protein
MILSHLLDDAFEKALQAEGSVKPSQNLQEDVFKRTPLSDKEIAINNLVHTLNPNGGEQNSDLLQKSLEAKDMPVFNALLRHTPNPDFPHLVEKAIKQENPDALEKLLVQANKTQSQIPKEILNGRNAPMVWAAENGHEYVVKELLKAGADHNQMFGAQKPLHKATIKGHEAITKLLLNAGANPNARSGTFTPLHYAASNNHKAIAKLLLVAGADPNARTNVDNDGQTPLCLAEKFNGNEVAQLLRDYKRKQDETN